MKIVSLIFACLIFSIVNAQATPMADMPLKLQKTEVSVLVDQYPFLKKDQEKSQKFMDKNPNIKPFEVFTIKLFVKKTKRELFVIQEQGDFVCGTKSCPLKIYDVTNGQKPQRLFSKVSPPLLHIAECPHDYSVILTGSNTLYQRYTLLKDGFELEDTYENLKSASQCKTKD